MVHKTLESRDILLYCDFHGHSRCKNLFMYGCSGPGGAARASDRLKERIFPLLFQANTENFSYNECAF
jgi:hypothetical protein